MQTDSILLGVDVHPLDELLKWLPEVDFAVLEHRFASHGRDYIVFIEDLNQGQHEVAFSHCVRADCETRVSDEVWPKSWSDEFTDYERWTGAKEPDGYVWGTTGRLPIQESRPFAIQLRPLNGPRDLASKCLRPRWRQTVSFCG